MALPEVVRVAPEDRFDVRLVTLQDERAGADGGLRLLQVAELLYHLRGDDPSAPGVRQRIDQPDVGLLQQKLHGIAVHHLDPVYKVQDITVRIPPLSQEAVIGKFDILGHQLAAVDGRLVVPFNPMAEVEHIRRIVQLLPALC